MKPMQSFWSPSWRRSMPSFLQASTPEKEFILDSIVDSDRRHVRDSVDIVTMMGRDLGIPRWSMRIDDATMFLKRSDEHDVALHALMAEMEDPASPFYSDRFTYDEVAMFFGLPGRDVDKVVSWMQSKKLESLKVSPGRTSITFSGNLLVLEDAFCTQFRRYRFKGKEYLANADELSVPAAISPVISGFCKLSRLVTEVHAHHQGSEISQKYADRR